MSEVIHASQGYVEKTARTIAADEVAKVVANAPQDLDTLKEIAAYIESDKTNAAQMVTKIDNNAKAISEEVERAQDAEEQLANKVKELDTAKADKTALEAEAKRAKGAEAALGEEISKKVDKEEGKGLSTNDYTNEDKAKLKGVEAGAQKNPDLSGYAKTADVEEAKQAASDAQGRAEAAENVALKAEQDVKAALPRCLLTTMSPTSEGHLIIDPFYLTRCQFGSELPGTLTIGLMDGEDFGNPHTYAREYILVVDLVGYDSSPRIEWGENFHPRTDKETDFACEAGKLNVYWITEYNIDEFCVAGWQETTGGNAA